MSDMRAALERIEKMTDKPAPERASDRRIIDCVNKIARSALAGDGETVRDVLRHPQWEVVMGALEKWIRDGGSDLVALGIISSGLLTLDDKRRAALSSHPAASHTVTSICGEQQLDVTPSPSVTSSPTAEPVQKLHELPGPEADALLCKIALLRLWQDTYPDGPDNRDQRYEVLPADVRTARAYVAARDASPVRPSWLPPAPAGERS